MTHIIKFRYFILVILQIALFHTNNVYAQQDIKIPRKSLKVGWQGYAEALESIEQGDKWLAKGKGAIPKAIEFYVKATEYNPNCPELNSKIGICYLNTDQKKKALPYLQNAYEKKPDATDDLAFQLARAYHYNGDFTKASQMYDTFYRSLKERKKEKYTLEIFKLIEECKNGNELAAQPKRAVIKNIGDSINSAFSDYNPILVQNDSVMFFTSRRPVGKRPKPNKKDYFFNENVYTAHKEGGEWRKSEYLDDSNINTKHHEAMVWASEDGKTRYIYDGYSRNGDIYVSTLKNDNWTNPKRLSKSINSKMKETSLSITADGKTIYFVSNDDDENFGGKDIYYIRLNRKGKFEKPRNIGSVLNTRFDEDCVYITPNGKKLYFSSTGHNTIGGYDIFSTEIDASGNWSKPVNLGMPVNTPDNDLFYRALPGEKKAYYSSVREDGFGGYDIYQVIFLGAEKQLLLRGDEQLVAYFNKPVTDIFARISGEMKIDSTFIIKGIVTDAATNAPIVAKLNLIDTDNTQIVASTITDSTGLYQIRISKIKSYGIEITAKNYMLYLDIISFPANTASRELLKNFKLTKIKAGVKIVLKNIYFESGKAVLTPESFTELDKIVTFLQENNELKIEISGHTDNVGGAAYNVKLSGSRAQAVVDYLIKKGIPQEQLVAKGYGPNQPISPNTTANGRKLNRRVEFKILSVE